MAKKYQTLLMATMSHELRTPLNGILGTTKMLLEKIDCPLQKEVTIIDSCAVQLLMKVNDMLDFAQNEMSTIKLYITDTKIKHLLKSVYNDFIYSSKAKNIDLNFKISPQIPNLLRLDEKKTHTDTS